MNRLFSEYTTLQYQNKAMRQELEAFRNGERYKKLQEDHHKVVAGYIKEIGRLKKELAKAHAATVTVGNIWFEECDSDWEKYQAELNGQHGLACAKPCKNVRYIALNRSG